MHTRSVSLCLLLAGFGLPSLLPAADPVPANFFGLHIVNGNYPTVPVGALRTVGTSWSSIQPSRRTFNWSGLDAQVNTALAHNLKVVYSTDQVPSWAAKSQSSCSSGTCSSGVANMADWDNFVTALVTRYKGKIEGYGLWDEPDGDFSGPMSDFLPLAQHFHDIIRAKDPAALVLSPGVVQVSWLDSYWAAGGVTDLDAVQFHGPFSTPVAETLIAEKITPLKAILAKYGLSAKAIWDTSDLWGDPTSLTNLQSQSAFVARSLLLHWSNGVKRTYWYSWDDNGDGPNGQGYGALANWQNNVPYPAGTAYAQIENWMIGAVMSTPCSAASDNTWTCGLTRAANYQALAIWNTSGSKPYTPAANFTQYRDLSGNTKPITGPITIGSQPILLVGTGTTPPPPTAPQITTTSFPGGQVGVAYNANLTASGGTTPYAWSISSGSLPAGLSLNAGTGAITGTPTTAGQSGFLAKVTDAATSPQSATAQLSLTVSTITPPTPPQITTSSLSAGQVGVVYSATLAASGGTAPYTWSITTGALPAGIKLNVSTGAITGTPAAAGSSTFTVRVGDTSSPAQSATKSFTVAVSAATPPPPQITTSSLSAGQVGVVYSATLAASGGTAPYTWSITAGALPAGIKLNASTGAITGTPTAAGSSTFTVTVGDTSSPAQSATKSFTIAVSAATPPPPQITTSSLSAGQVGVVYSATLAASGGTAPYTWSITTGALPAGINLNAGTGAITGTPAAAGTSTFTVRVGDTSSPAQSATKSFTIAVSAATPPPPQITTSSLSAGQVGVVYNATLAASGGTAPYTWSITTGALPAGINLSASTGAITGTPTAAGSSTFTIRVGDTSSPSQSVTKALTIGISAVTPPGTAAIPATFFGMHMQETSTNWPTVSTAAYRTSAVSWPKMEPQKGTFTWGEMDRQVAMASQHGVPVYYATDGIPSWFSASNMADWDNYITALATRYKGKIEIYELWNEPEYDTLPPLATFVVMAQHMRDIIRAIDPAAKIASPGVDTVSYIDTFWAAGGPKDVDVVAFHGYPYGNKPETVVQKVTAMKASMAKYGVNKPLYDSEGSFGDASYGVTSTADKTNFIPRYELLQWSNGVTRHYWYSWDDSVDGTNGIGWGTLYDGVKNQILPMAATYQQTYNWMVGATMSTPCSMAGDSTWTCGLTRPGGYQALAIWNPSTSKQYTPANIYTQYKDVSGNVIPVSGAVTIGNAPILLEGTGGTTPPPTLQITSSSLAGGQVGTAYGATLAASGGTTPYSWSISAGSLPAGLTLNTNSGAISGTPTIAAVSNFTVRVGDVGASPQSATAQLSITVSAIAPPPPPTLLVTTASLPAVQVQGAYAATLAASGGTAPDKWSITVGTLPVGLTLNTNNGAISGTPSASGPSTFTVMVADSAPTPQSATKQLSINVTPATLGIQTISLPNGQLTVAYSTTMAGKGGTLPYTWTVLGNLPAGLSLTSAGVLSGTPTTAAISSFNIQVTDGASQIASGPFSITVSGASTTSAFNHVVIVVAENMNYADVIGSPLMPYLNGLASTYGSATQFYANTHPSIGNYFWMLTGQQLTNDDSRDPSNFPVSADNVVRQLLAGGKTWKSYSEDLPSVGYIGGDTGNYAVRHNPIAYLTDVQSSATQRQNLVPFTQFSQDLGNNALPNYSFVTPNLCNDAHDCGIDVADSWLQTHIGPLVNNAAFQKDGMLIIVFDESANDNTNGGGRIPFIVVTPQGKPNLQSTTFYQFQSLLRLSLQALGIKSWPAAAATAPSMSEFFKVPLP